MYRGQKGVADEKGVVVIYIYAKMVIDTKKRYKQDISTITNIYNNE